MNTSSTRSQRTLPWLAWAVALLATVALAGCGSSSSTTAGSITGGTSSATFVLNSATAGTASSSGSYVYVPISITYSGSPQYAVVQCCVSNTGAFTTAGVLSGTSATMTLVGTLSSTGGSHIVNNIELYSVDTSTNNNWTATDYLVSSASDTKYQWIEVKDVNGTQSYTTSYSTGTVPVASFTY